MAASKDRWPVLKTTVFAPKNSLVGSWGKPFGRNDGYSIVFIPPLAVIKEHPQDALYPLDTVIIKTVFSKYLNWKHQEFCQSKGERNGN